MHFDFFPGITHADDTNNHNNNSNGNNDNDTATIFLPSIFFWKAKSICIFCSLYQVRSYFSLAELFFYFYKNIIRNDKLKKFTSEDFLNLYLSILNLYHSKYFYLWRFFRFFFTLLLLLSRMVSKELFFYLIKYYEALP